MSRRFYPLEGGTRDLPWIVLYGLTFGLQLVCAIPRGIALYIPILVAFWVTGHDPTGLTANAIAYVLAFGPLVWSLTALIYPLGAGPAWRISSGGRAPSEQERKLVDRAINEIQARDSQVRAPRSWFVLDDWQLNAAALGDTLMITTGTIADPALTAVIAHELGHLNSTDCHLSVAVGRLTAPAEAFLWIDRRIEGGGCLAGLFVITGQFCSGLLALAPTRPLWDAWFRAREFKADEYAAKLGYAEALADGLTRHALEDDRPTPFRFVSGASHPYTTHRIDALNDYARRYANVYV
jgi:Zn-dependent protease with chaperone function